MWVAVGISGNSAATSRARGDRFRSLLRFLVSPRGELLQVSDRVGDVTSPPAEVHENRSAARLLRAVTFCSSLLGARLLARDRHAAGGIAIYGVVTRGVSGKIVYS